MSQGRRLAIVLALNVLLVVGLAVVGFAVGSTALLAAAGDGLADAFALTLGLLAVHMRDRRGLPRATTVVAMVNVAVLLLVAVGVVAESVQRLAAGAPPVPGVPVLVAALVAAALLGAGAVVLGRGAAEEDLHMRSVLLDTAGDALSALGVAATGAVIAVVHGLYWLDPAVAILISVLLAVLALRLLRRAIPAMRAQEPVIVDRG